MNTIGIIAEYNPFHNGHQYHIAKARELSGADSVIILMSGNFVQRGEPAITDKYHRAAMAIAGGADVVLELPVSYATGTAERFAYGAVDALHRLRVVKSLAYGCETPSSELWSALTELLNHPTPAYDDCMQQRLKEGLSYPAARSIVCEHLIPGSGSLLKEPNNILALEYRRAMARIDDCQLKPLEVKRLGSGYHEAELPTDHFLPSASAIRSLLLAGYDKEEPSDVLTNLMPRDALRQLTYAMQPDDLSPMLRHILLHESLSSLMEYQDMNEDLARRLLAMIQAHPYASFTELGELLKNKSLTRTRINRALLHIALRLKASAKEPQALRLLALRKNSPVLREMMDQTQIPVITKMANAPAGIFDDDIRASHIYNQLVYEKYGIRLVDEFRQSPLVL